MAQDSSQTKEDSFYSDNNNQADSEDEHRWSNSQETLPMPWTLASSKSVHRMLAQRAAVEIQAKERILKRKLTYPEQECIKYWSAKEIQIFSAGRPLGLLAGLYWAYAKRSTYRFPFYQPPADFNPNIVKGFGGSIIFEGARARIFWHANRAAISGLILGQICGALASTSAALWWTMRGRYEDPRMADVVQVMKQQYQRNHEEFQRMREQKTTRDSTAMREEQARRNEQRDSQPSSNNQNARPSQQNRPTQQDPYSLQSAREYPQEDSTSPTSYDYNEASPTSPLQQSYQTNSNQQQYPPSSSQSTPPSDQPRRRDQDRGFFDDTYDDASPTARHPPPKQSQPNRPNRNNNNNGNNDDSNYGGSAWDRIRSGASSTNSDRDRYSNPPARGNPADPYDGPESSNGQRGAWSRLAEDRQSPKSQAQSDFDDGAGRNGRGRDF